MLRNNINTKLLIAYKKIKKENEYLKTILSILDIKIDMRMLYMDKYDILNELLLENQS